ncbi:MULTISPECIES: GMC oxidoreductase [Cryobacterium]|uniref:GMC oxidoreductase n=1 Tax=Cryobacterium sp. N19 TaxID=2048288 RepID=UPI0018E0BCD4
MQLSRPARAVCHGKGHADSITPLIPVPARTGWPGRKKTALLNSRSTAIHLCDNARFGPADGPGAVINQYGHVHGIEGLRVPDTSNCQPRSCAGLPVQAVVLGQNVAFVLGGIGSPPSTLGNLGIGNIFHPYSLPGRATFCHYCVRQGELLPRPLRHYSGRSRCLI